MQLFCSDSAASIGWLSGVVKPYNVEYKVACAAVQQFWYSLLIGHGIRPHTDYGEYAVHVFRERNTKADSLAAMAHTQGQFFRRFSNGHFAYYRIWSDGSCKAGSFSIGGYGIYCGEI